MPRQYIFSREDIQQQPETDDTVACVIPPKGVIGRHDRRILQRSALIEFCIPADVGDGTPPTSFNQPTLQWALQLADAVAIWSGETPDATTERAAHRLMRDFFALHRRRGGRVVQINVLHQHTDEWMAYTREACRPNIPIRLILNMPEAK
jgi:hypothetical protein